MTKNSQYINQGNCAIGDIFRLTLNETQDGVNFITVGVFAMHVELAKNLANSMLQTIAQHERNIEMQKKNNDTDKGLN